MEQINKELDNLKKLEQTLKDLGFKNTTIDWTFNGFELEVSIKGDKQIHDE